MRTTPAFLTIVGLSALALVGCSADSTASCTRVADSDASSTDLVTVVGEVGTVPEVEVYTPFRVDDTVWNDLAGGEGTAITTPEQLVVLDMVVVNGQTGEVAVATSFDEAPTSVYSMQRWMDTLPGLEEALQCAQEGSRVVVGLPSEAINPEAAAQIGLAEGESAVAVVDVRKVYLPHAEGADQFVDTNGLPTVVRAPSGQPGVLIPDTAPPEDLVVKTLIKGDGPVVTGDEPVRVHYTGLVWDTKEIFDTSWGKEPASFDLDAVVPGFSEGLKGQTVGSQVLIVIPPDQGYGDQTQGAIPGGSTLVFVVDILGLDAVPAS